MIARHFVVIEATAQIVTDCVVHEGPQENGTPCNGRNSRNNR